MKRYITVLMIVLAFVFSASANVTQQQLDAIAQRIVDSNSLTLGGDIVVDGRAAGGFASISWQRNWARIAVDPDEMRNTSENSWAFVLGHEISHQVLGHQGQQRAAHEFHADEVGARLAIRAGYNLESYIRDMYGRPNSCSLSHGCFHSRARNLEIKFQVNTEMWRDEHARHSIAMGLFPPWSR